MKLYFKAFQDAEDLTEWVNNFPLKLEVELIAPKGDGYILFYWE